MAPPLRRMALPTVSAPEFGRALELLEREAYQPKDRLHRLTVEIEDPIES